MVFELDGKILLPYGWTYFNFQSILYIRYNIIITKCCSRRQRDLLSLLNEMLIGWKQCWSLEAGGIYCRYFRRAAATSLLLSTDEVHNAQNMLKKCTKYVYKKHKIHKMHKKQKCTKSTKCTDSLENAAGCTLHDDLPDTTHRLTALPPSRKAGTICFFVRW